MNLFLVLTTICHKQGGKSLYSEVTSPGKVEVRGTGWGPCIVRSRVRGELGLEPGGSCMVRSNASCLMVAMGPHACGQTDTNENITFPETLLAVGNNAYQFLHVSFQN